MLRGLLARAGDDSQRPGSRYAGGQSDTAERHRPGYDRAAASVTQDAWLCAICPEGPLRGAAAAQHSRNLYDREQAAQAVNKLNSSDELRR